MKLTITKETLAELTADDLNAVIGAGHESASCSLATCISRPSVMVTGRVVVDDVDICELS